MKTTLIINLVLPLFITLIITTPSIMAQSSISDKKELETVAYVDLEKYAGDWYEIAKIPNKFQSDCASNTTATYKLREDQKIDVINRCVEKDGSVNEVKGIAKVVDEKTNSKLEVSFVRILGISLFWGDYWIIGLDENYNYAVVGNPSRKYGWILSRTPKLSEAELEKVYSILREHGYDPADFVMTAQ